MFAKVAVIIPAYNAEKSLNRTVQSLLSQTLKEIEIWIVNDGSLDKTGDIANTLAQEDSRIHVIHQENKGCYMARLAALRQIKTPYFGFVDADDTIEPNMYEEMLSFAEAHNLDIVECTVVGEVKNNGVNEVYQTRDDIYKKVIYPLLIEGSAGGAFVWNKLYRHQYDFSAFKEIPILMFEDLVFNLQFFLPVESFGRLHMSLYHYDVNEGSSVKNWKLKNLFDFEQTIQFKREITPKYGHSSQDIVLDQWTILNARNNLISASSAPAASWKIRVKNVKTLLASTEINAAITRLKQQNYTSRHLSLLCCAKRFPFMTTLALYILKRLRNILKK